MIHISAQPFSIYFAWQLEIQLHNFSKHGIAKDCIHVLFSFDPEIEIPKELNSFTDRNKLLAEFFCYPDLRSNVSYTSTIRPHILKQHFAKFKYLEDETIFYHDSDILFSRSLNINVELHNTTCYVSDTRNYLDVSYIRASSSEELLEGMLKEVGLEKSKLLNEDAQTGGAQYILKGINSSFWEKVEEDSENLYVLMNAYNKKCWEEEYAINKEYRSKKRGIQAWCADMWAVLWNLWLLDKKVEIHPEMDFSWPFDSIVDWDKKAIQHYSGDIKDKTQHFKKTEYLNYPPWYDDGLIKINQDTCSYKIVEFIQSHRQRLDDERPIYSKICVIFNQETLTDRTLERYLVLKKYLQKYLALDVFILEKNEHGSDHNFNQEKVINKIVANDYSEAILMSLDFCVDYVTVEAIFNRTEKSDRFFYSTTLYRVDELFLEAFAKVLDMELFYVNRGKFNMQADITKRGLFYFRLPPDVESKCKVLETYTSNAPKYEVARENIEVAFNFL
ncbi:hypothetical protein [Sphingobacterium griseoflavum]|uniref:Nucleotide-diphospho-sugar transferase domain-containing protein n=1 Tax=Sphingobacterium griseoflavum TaxID=1474952 RepID=A0ABQ3HY49_9SPHI|nr:hypothetical protein [Sphingobacterium griseoflavum]GHE31815.1 hypothetical protein GCM10017764_13700 [Sphingobacterium griseoflavum]